MSNFQLQIDEKNWQAETRLVIRKVLDKCSVRYWGQDPNCRFEQSRSTFLMTCLYCFVCKLHSTDVYCNLPGQTNIGWVYKVDICGLLENAQSQCLHIWRFIAKVAVFETSVATKISWWRYRQNPKKVAILGISRKITKKAYFWQNWKKKILKFSSILKKF